MAMKYPKFEIWKTGNLWYWHLKARNGEILCVSEGYTTEQSAVKGTNAARRAAPFATTTITRRMS
jgi:hypothetical protein